MSKKLLVERKRGKYYSKSIEIVENPKSLIPVLNPTSWRIISLLSKEPLYPNEIAKRLKIHEQKVYYHIKRLRKAGLIEVIKEEVKRGAICKFFAPVAEAFGIEIPEKIGKEIIEKSEEGVKKFFYEFIKDGVFDGIVVVGSPLQHGPFLTAARDGHYAIQLSMFLGGFCNLGKKLIVKLDTEIKSEKLEKNNLILIGGPITNMLAGEVNEKLKIRFVWKGGNWRVFSKISKKEYLDEDIGLIAKIRNPWKEGKVIVLLAGLKFEGTCTCILAVTNFFEKIFRKYENRKEFYCLIKGLDKDGDGKVDSIKMLESYISP